jgi:hypothetical protein
MINAEGNKRNAKMFHYSNALSSRPAGGREGQQQNRVGEVYL